MYIYPTITINGVSSTTIRGLLITALAPISKPAQRALVDVIDGRAGDVITPLGFAAYDKPVTIALTKGYDIDEVIKFFNSEGVVTFSNEPDKYYNFAIYEQIDFERLIRFKTATVIFHVQPYKYANNENPLNFAITSGEPVTVKNSGNTDSKPVLIVTGEGVVDLDINGEQVLNIDFGEDEQAYIIDSDAMNAYATENAIKDVKAEFSASQASGTPTPSAPIPIVGVSAVQVTRAGKNLLSTSYKSGYYNTNGKWVNNSSYGSYDITLKAGTYTFSTDLPNCYIIRYFIDTTETVINTEKQSQTFTLAKESRFRISFRNISTTEITAPNSQLELGSTATEYEPYNGTTALINLGGTYYGGSVDAVTGKIPLDHGLNTFDGTEANWSATDTHIFRLITTGRNWLPVNAANWQLGYLSNILRTDVRATGATSDKLPDHSFYITSQYLYVRCDEYELADFKTALGSTNLQIVAPLATPETVYASNTAEIPTILGVNNIFSDAGDVDVTYRAGGVIHTETGEIVTFTLTPEDYERGAFVNRQIVGNYDNIKLKRGANTISLTGNATSLTVDKYSRWI